MIEVIEAMRGGEGRGRGGTGGDLSVSGTAQSLPSCQLPIPTLESGVWTGYSVLGTWVWYDIWYLVLGTWYFAQLRWTIDNGQWSKELCDEIRVVSGYLVSSI